MAQFTSNAFHTAFIPHWHGKCLLIHRPAGVQGSEGPPCVTTWSSEIPGGLNVPHVFEMKINMGENLTTVPIPEVRPASKLSRREQTLLDNVMMHSALDCVTCAP